VKRAFHGCPMLPVRKTEEEGEEDEEEEKSLTGQN
jgi:hypothetical protein